MTTTDMWLLAQIRKLFQRVVKPTTPVDLRAAIAELMTYGDLCQEFLNAETEDNICAAAHFSLGLRLRNQWGLWQGSVLAKWFASQGITHADDMSGIIIASLYRTLHLLPVEFGKQCYEYQQHWLRQIGKPIPDATWNTAAPVVYDQDGSAVSITL